MKYSIPFSMSEKILQNFVLLTKDSNSLHINPKFARQSIYGKNVIHGMLPVLLISIFPSIIGLQYFCFKSISASFLKPVFLGESFLIHFVIESLQPDQLEYEVNFSISNVISGVVYTTGSFVLESQNTDEVFEFRETQDNSPSMVIEPLVESDLRFDQIEKYDYEQFEFQITNSVVYLFSQIICNSSGIDICSQNTSNFNNLLAVCLFSTFVGICIPGQNATFIDFNAVISNNIKKFRKYLLRGEVSFKSKSLDVLVLGIRVEDIYLGVNLLSGKIKAKVNEASPKMLSFDDLSIKGLGLENKVVLITGASGGIGETTAKIFSTYGSKIIVNFNKGQDDAYRIVNEIKCQGGNAIAVKADISQKQEVKLMIQEAIRHYNTIDILVNNAVAKNLPESFLNITWDNFQHDIDVNVKGVFNCCQEVLPHMIEMGSGKIINIGTVMTDIPEPQQSKYIITKSAIVGLTRSLAIEMASHNIQVNMVCPHLVDTNLTNFIPKMFFLKTKNETPLKRLATPSDVANAIIFLSSSLSNFTTGQKFMVTGGNAPFF